MTLHMEPTASTATTTDRIDKRVLIHAPRTRIWHALTDAREFGSWFGVALDGAVPFTPGAHVQAKVTHPGYEHVSWDVTIERVEPEHLFSWRWHPHAVEPGSVDYAVEPTTLVVFELDEVADGTLLTVAESGFDGIPLARRTQAYRGNDEGWSGQLKAIAQHVSGLT